ncbi:MAG: nicotinate (nicotinamide) nucleotide adenylyltransferase [Myxococcales bacterium]|nr:nicotinate (nicotinamide) nucleotide adenylyltransferase [Myxococcales bacterium]
MTERIGVFGGSFNPPHVCHTLVVAYALAAYDLDRVLVIPCNEHAFAKDLARFEDRIAMCRLAFACFGERAEISTIERDLGGTSRTLHTLEALAERRPDAELFLLIGSDILQETDKWYRFDAILERAALIVIGRTSYPLADDGAEVPILPDMSSTEIRRRTRDGLSLERLLSPSVIDYVRAQHLYQI